MGTRTDLLHGHNVRAHTQDSEKTSGRVQTAFLRSPPHSLSIHTIGFTMMLPHFHFHCHTKSIPPSFSSSFFSPRPSLSSLLSRCSHAKKRVSPSCVPLRTGSSFWFALEFRETLSNIQFVLGVGRKTGKTAVLANQMNHPVFRAILSNTAVCVCLLS